MPRLVRRADVVVFPAVGAALHVGLPLALARRDGRRRRNTRIPGLAKCVGMSFVLSGAALVASAALHHYRLARDDSPLEGAPWPGATPEYIVLGGPYAFTRNPMYLGELMMWLGWTVLLGSRTVAGGSAALAGGMTFVVRREERRLTAAFGDEYRRYMTRVPRWLPALGR